MSSEQHSSVKPTIYYETDEQKNAIFVLFKNSFWEIGDESVSLFVKKYKFEHFYKEYESKSANPNDVFTAISIYKTKYI